MTLTKSSNLIIPEVLADMVQAELAKKVRFEPLAVVDTTLNNQPGDKIKVPAWDYIGDAKDLAEGASIEITQMSTTSKEMTVKQIGKAVEITDYALEVGYDDALQAASEQIALAHAQKIDEDMLTALRSASLSYEAPDLSGGTAATDFSIDHLEHAIAKFNDEDLADMVLVASPRRAIELTRSARNASMCTELGAKSLLSGAFAKVLGCEIVRSKRLADSEAYLVKVGALRLIKKREVNLETDRDILKKSTVLSADSIYGCYLYDAKKAVRITIPGQ